MDRLEVTPYHRIYSINRISLFESMSNDDLAFTILMSACGSIIALSINAACAVLLNKNS